MILNQDQIYLKLFKDFDDDCDMTAMAVMLLSPGRIRRLLLEVQLYIVQSVLETFHRDCFELNHTAIYSKQSALDQSGIVCHVLCGYNTDRACVVTEENEGDVVLHGVKTEPHSKVCFFFFSFWVNSLREQ